MAETILGAVDVVMPGGVDTAALAERFARTGRIEIPVFLDIRSAEALRRHLLARVDWLTVLNAGDKVFEMTREGRDAMSPAQRAALDARVNEAARCGFQYRYETIRVPDADRDRLASATMLDSFARTLSSAPVLALLEAITGVDDLAFADAQATLYSCGDFLTAHDDDVAGKQRRAAYVLGLTPDWRAEFGGLLMFHGKDGNIDEAFVPAMGALRLFRVPTLHSVSHVAPIAPEPRLSVTGWLRARP